MKLSTNFILRADDYKSTAPLVFPDDVTAMFSYIEARTNGKDVIVGFGQQMYAQKFLSDPITYDDVNEAVEIKQEMGTPFDRAPWDKIVKVYDGRLPIKIRSVPEGLPVPSSNIMMSVECDDPDLFWLAQYIETDLVRAVWYPSTIASLDYKTKNVLKEFYLSTGADVNLIPYALHDFGARGVTCEEQAEIGGAAHLVHFAGSDNLSGVRAARFYYYSKNIAGSAAATEHSVECSYGKQPNQELEYIRSTIIKLRDAEVNPSRIVSIVIDGYDVYRAAEAICTQLKDLIIESGVKVVFRPDSGEPSEVIPRILDLQAATFGFTINSKGYKKINHVGLLQGDGVDHDKIIEILELLKSLNYAADNIVFGSGGGLLQKVNRDTFKFAQKAAAILKNGKWVGIAKDPITDPGKKSKEGLLTLVKSYMTGEYMTVKRDFQNDDLHDMMFDLYDHGFIDVSEDFNQIRQRTGTW